MGEAKQFEQALQILRQGGVVGYPSETVWGLAALPAHWEVLASRKGREADKPMQVSCADASAALRFAQPSLPLSTLLEVLPGPLTVVTPAHPDCPPALAPGGKVGLRIPDHPVARALLSLTGPLLTTSLNPAGQSPARTFEEAQRYGLADLLLGSAGDVAGGQASTVVELPLPPGTRAWLRRSGAFAPKDIAALLRSCGVELVPE